MSLVRQPHPSPCSDEQHNVEVKNKMERDNETRNEGINQHNIEAPPSLQAEREDDRTNDGGVLVLKNMSASTSTTETEETSIANHDVTKPSVKPDCIEKNHPFDVNSAPLVRIDHPLAGTAPSNEPFEDPLVSEKERTTHATQVGDGDEENDSVTAASATKEPALAVEILMDSDYLENNEDVDLSAVVLADKGKGVDPREYGNTLYDPKAVIVSGGTTSTGRSDLIELIGVHRNKGRNVDPEERGNGMAKYEPGPSRIDFHDHGVMSSPKQGIPLELFEPTKTTNINHDLPYDPGTLHRPSWHPKVSPYRFIVFLTSLAIGTAKAVLSQKGSLTTPITLEWIYGTVIFLILFLLGSYETRRDTPKYISWLFKLDCVDIVWYLAAKLSIQRPEYLTTERDDEFDLGAFVTSYRILVSAVVVFLGSLKATFTYSNFLTVAVWVEWLFAALVTSLLYLVGLYENNSLGLWSSFFQRDRSHSIHMDFIDSTILNVISLPSIISFAFVLVICSAQLIPVAKRTAREAISESIEDSQLPIGPTLPKATVEELYLVVLFYMPFVIFYVMILYLLMTQLWGSILSSTSMLPPVIRYHTSRFVGAIEKFSQKRPIDRIIYHFVAFGQLLLLVTFNVWSILAIHFAGAFVDMQNEAILPLSTLSIKILLYISMVMILIASWSIAAGDMRWWPSRDRLSRLIPPSITNATISKFIHRQVKALGCLGSSGPSNSSSSDCSEGHLLIISYLVVSIIGFYGGYTLANARLLVDLPLPLVVPLFILFALYILLWLYLGCTIFPDVFRDVLWRRRQLLHYSFQDFTESVRDSVESHSYWWE